MTSHGARTQRLKVECVGDAGKRPVRPRDAALFTSRGLVDPRLLRFVKHFLHAVRNHHGDRAFIVPTASQRRQDDAT